MNNYRIPILVGATLSATLWAYACGDGTTEPPTPPPDPPRPTTVTVSPATAQLAALGATVQFSVEVRDQNGQVMAGATVAWASDNAPVATVDGSGLVTAVGNGMATITATAGTVSGTATVMVAQEVSAVTVSPAADTLVAGDTLRLAVEAMDATGHPVAGAEFSWASSDPLVAVVDDAGIVTGVEAGEVEVTATAAGVTGRADLTVVAPAPTTIAITPDTVALAALGQTAQLAAEVRDQAGRAMEGVPVAWSSGDTIVAAVDSAGLVTAAGAGETTITATSGEASGQAVVTVMQAAGSLIVSPAADTVAQGDTLRLVAEAFDENGHRVEGAQFDWSSSAVSVARVDGSGLVTGVAEGTATITATSGDARGTAEITVQNPDRAALVALYNATDGPSWVNSENWLTDAPLREWYGVDTNGSGRVVGLDLSGRWDSEARVSRRHGLVGPIPPELGSLTHLQSLNLEHNDLFGPIPTELASRVSLTHLRLAYNQLTGSIPPELGNLANLTKLDLWSNQLTDPIPPELGNLANLTELNLGFNPFTGPIPPELGNLASLTALALRGNELTGPIPPELGNLANLTELNLSGNDLSGPIPPELGNLANLTWLTLSGNELTGPVPPELGRLANLTGLGLFANQLTGPIPQSFLQLERLGTFWIEDNVSLCVPGTSPFVAWLHGMVRHDVGSAGPCNAADVAELKSLFDATGGTGWTESTGWRGEGAVEEWHGVTSDSLGRVTELDLTRNGLVGQLPPSLGALTRMTVLRIGGNVLRGRLPLSLAQLALRDFRYADTELCAPVEASFQAWLDAIPSHEGTGVECAPLSDRDILEILYKTTGGPAWFNSTNWLTDPTVRDWFGVSVDGEGRVRFLDLTGNNLSGPLPLEIGNLANLTSLQLRSNQLTGPIPPEIGNLANLTSLQLRSNQLTGPIPPEIGSLANLTRLDLGGNQLTGPIPPEIGSLANLTRLDLGGNQLTGPIPPEIGSLANLTRLDLGGNQLTGPIPPEIGSLASLTGLYLVNNALTGPIPPEIGSLANLTRLYLWNNALTGPIPPQLGNLANLTSLQLGDNQLTGTIPPQLGNLANLTHLGLGDNALSGSLPPQLGNLTIAEELLLDNNNLEGPVPPGLGGMASLQELSLTHNAGMEGALPTEMTGLHQLDVLLAGGTDLCAPSDADFRAWLGGVRKRRIAPCVAGGPSMAYLTQAVQSREFPVPLIAGEKALLRVFPTARQATSVDIPAVRARFFVNGRETHVKDIPGKPTPIPTAVDESRLSKSANAEIPAEVIEPGLEMVIEVDPDGTLDPSLGVAKRIPEAGRLAVEIRTMPVFDLTVIPFIWSQTNDQSIVELVEAMAADPEGHDMLEDTRTRLPIGDLVVTAHEPVMSGSNYAYDLSAQTGAIRAMEGGTGHYMGMMWYPVTGPVGLAGRPGRSSFSTPHPAVMAHELGHNLSLQHAPCGRVGNPDPSFPYPDGSIGTWGYGFRDGKLKRPAMTDLMSYCFANQWISDYSFTNALRYRLFDKGPPAARAIAASSKSLLLWGGVGADSVLFLEPAFVVEAPAALPDSAGEYVITGRAADGSELFSLPFTMPETADGDGSSGFAFVLPVRPGWEGNLASITLTGPGGSFTLDGDSDLSVTILRNPRNGQVRGILRDLPGPAQAAMDSATGQAGPGLEVLFSRGIPDAGAWRR